MSIFRRLMFVRVNAPGAYTNFIFLSQRPYKCPHLLLILIFLLPQSAPPIPIISSFLRNCFSHSWHFLIYNFLTSFVPIFRISLVYFVLRIPQLAFFYIIIYLAPLRCREYPPRDNRQPALLRSYLHYSELLDISPILL